MAEIYECRPGNMPEDIIPDFDESIPFIIGSTEEEAARELSFKHRLYGWRKPRNKCYSWCGEHPRFWREMTEAEKSSFRKFMSNIRKHLR